MPLALGGVWGIVQWRALAQTRQSDAALAAQMVSGIRSRITRLEQQVDDLVLGGGVQSLTVFAADGTRLSHQPDGAAVPQVDVTALRDASESLTARVAIDSLPWDIQLTRDSAAVGRRTGAARSRHVGHLRR